MTYTNKAALAKGVLERWLVSHRGCVVQQAADSEKPESFARSTEEKSESE